MSALREFQHSFAQTLLEPRAVACSQYGAGIAVYQNTVAKGLVDVLRANFPTVMRLVGDEWFYAVALRYAREHQPAQPALALYGAGFADFLESIAAVQLPYLPFVARLDRLWTEVHFATDAPTLQAQHLALLSAERLSVQTVRLHPAARFTRCAHSAVTIWRANRPPVVPPEELAVADENEAVLITRPNGHVQVEPLSLAGHKFLLRLQAGETFGAVADALLAEDTDTDITTLLATLLQAGAFFGSRSNEGEET